MRIIGGSLRGRRLAAPPGLATRPTADRVRESVFNILGGSLSVDLVLDLYAGTGALGIEALSRGAGRAILVDQARSALSVIRRNLQALHLEDRSRVVGADIRRGLRFLHTENTPVGLVFMDPPYADGMIASTLAALVDSGTLASGARIVIEHGRREAVAPSLPELILSDQRRYGKTLVSFLDCML